MLDKWTGEVVGTMHIYGINQKELAMHMGIAEKYLCAVLNCRRKPKGIEFKVRKALAEMMDEAVCPG
jgi:hypothetical protein